MATESIETAGEWDRFDRRERLLRYVALLGTVLLTYVSWQALNVRYSYLVTAPEMTLNLFRRMYPPDATYAPEIVAPMIATINIAVVGTILAIVMAIPVAYLGARNTTPNRYTYGLGKFLIVASRSVHVIIWAIVFVIVFGTGTLAGILAVAFRSVGFLAKLISEEIEEIDRTAVEAVEATGANGLKTMLYGIVPQVKPAFIGLSVYRWDINVREATIIGFVGAGGIGMELQTRIDFFDWSGVLTILLAILVVVIFSELLSAWVRGKVR
ncbi:phosphonate ABC transporter, permease protein PhnE [Halorubrum sp. JWXQ-INN 858]|uniref:phosphonate ABC transporter, permease protein PhnE n=1 Tax=Halorubrum sp. JWXQ-INN 858 TaxID=2690782 RepID=UPI00135BF467|nr:phosphonate ABC transporter, permease protein PhnE [Halorubrum sp. JWXQ-INN 858]MWV64082.1 phosphonate ABC transporter, permease protein PhnE [Halorubrum sp. JWXQ-INN 858]